MAQFTRPFTFIRGIQPGAEEIFRSLAMYHRSASPTLSTLQEMLKEIEHRRLDNLPPIKYADAPKGETIHALREMLKEYRTRR